MVAGGVFFFLGGAAGFLSYVLIYKMIDAINRTRGKDNLISYVGFTPLKYWTIFKEYARLYPDGKLSLYVVAAYGLAFVAWAGFMVCLVNLVRSRSFG
jgi:hypothetical protein